MMSPRRPLSDEEQALWQQATSHDEKLGMDERYAPPPPRKRTKPVAIRFSVPPIMASDMVSDAIETGHYAGIDRNTAERFRKGEKAIDATLDLHGMTTDRAFHALVQFIQTQYHRGSRVLLVITGKGARSAEEGGNPRGVLRAALPQWLGTAELRPLVLAVDNATQKHGGNGAYYILLKRRRVMHG
jgi:DNA-nicking Smr family endonuclease